MYHQLELARTGAALFKVRGKFLKYVGLLSVAVAYYHGAMGPFTSESANLAWFCLSLGVASAGAAVRIFTSAHAAPGTSGSGKVTTEAAELNTTGAYSLVRNPLYLGRILNFTGIAMLSGSWIFGALTFFVCVLIYERISVYEEEFLRAEYGDSHARWAEEVPFLYPRLHGWVKPKHPFWVRRCIKREEKKLIWLVSVIAVCDFAQRGFDIAQLPDNLFWYYLWAAGLLAYMFSRGLRYFTPTYDGIT